MPTDNRWLFWDGIPNISKGSINAEINCAFSLASTATAFTPAAQAIPGAGAVVVSKPSVTVERVDPWFTPIEHALGIHIRLENMKADYCLLLRIYADETCVYHRTWSGAELTKLRTDDPRTADALRGVVQANPWKVESKKNEARLVDQPGETVRYSAYCWVGPKPITFRAVLAPATRAQVDTFAGVKNTEEDRFGRNKTVVSKLVEEVMGGTTKLIFHDRESPDQVFAGYSGSVANPPLTAPASDYPTFKPLIYDVLYKTAMHTRIGLALIRDVADAANGAKTVEVFPTRTLHPNLGGVGVNDEFRDDYTIEQKLRTIRTAYGKAPAVPVPASEQIVDDSTRPLDAAAITAESRGGAHLKLSARFNYAARRWLYRKIGASKDGCRARFYFNLGFIDLLNNGGYQVAHHTLKNQYDVKLGGKARKLNEAGITFTKPNDLQSTVNLETPFFVAFLHEMVHARRLQLGLNAEWDQISGSAEKFQHPSSLVSTLRSQPTANEPAYKDFIKNLIAGYNMKNLEELDTVEGAGATVKVTGADADRARALKIPFDDVGTISVNENTIRRDLGIDLRFRYEENRRDPQTASYHVYKPGFILRRKFVPPITRQKMRVPAEPKLSDIAAGFDKLLKEVGSTAKAFTIQPDVNCVLLDSTSFGAAYRFGVLGKRPHNTYKQEDVDEYQNMAANIANNRDWIVTHLPQVAGALLAGNTAMKGPPAVDTTGEAGRLNAMRMLQAIAAMTDSSDRAYLLDKLDDVRNSVGMGAAVLAQAGLKLGLVMEANKDWSTDQDARCLNLQHRQVAGPQYAHMLVHEAMHVQSFRGEGFTAWARPAAGVLSTGTADSWGGFCAVLNEGTTELFARLVSYRLSKFAKAAISEAELIEELLSYEFATRFCAQLVRLIDAKKAPGEGLKLLGQAFYDGKFDAFATAWGELDAAKVLFDQASRLDINNNTYKEGTAPTDALVLLCQAPPGGAGLLVPTAEEVKTMLGEKKYLDPVLQPSPLVADLAGYKPSYSAAL